MEGLFSLLIFAGLFYFMMRFGCGAHMIHGQGGHGGHGGEGEAPDTGHTGHEQPSAMQSRATDPVCHMEVAPGQGYTKMHDGHSYRFCSRACLDKFEAAPQQYAA